MEEKKKNQQKDVKRYFECNEEYLFAPPQRDTLWDLVEQIYELGHELIDAANNAERVNNLRALRDLCNTLHFDCNDYLLDLGATGIDDEGECYDAIVLPTKVKRDK